MTARLHDKKEDIDLLVFRDPAEEEENSKEELESSQRMLIFSGSRDEQSRFNTPSMVPNQR
jgi:hypothetical protein